jgi:hypothetical protein
MVSYLPSQKTGKPASEFECVITADEIAIFRSYKYLSDAPEDTEMASRFRASDVVFHQWELVQKASGTVSLPKRIVRVGVNNDVALKVIQAFDSGTDSLKDAFLAGTPNGKMTSWLLERLSLSATKVESVDVWEGGADIIVHVVPSTGAVD